MVASGTDARSTARCRTRTGITGSRRSRAIESATLNRRVAWIADGWQVLRVWEHEADSRGRRAHRTRCSGQLEFATRRRTARRKSALGRSSRHDHDLERATIRTSWCGGTAVYLSSSASSRVMQAARRLKASRRVERVERMARVRLVGLAGPRRARGAGSGYGCVRARCSSTAGCGGGAGRRPWRRRTWLPGRGGR